MEWKYAGEYFEMEEPNFAQGIDLCEDKNVTNVEVFVPESMQSSQCYGIPKIYFYRASAYRRAILI